MTTPRLSPPPSLLILILTSSSIDSWAWFYRKVISIRYVEPPICSISTFGARMSTSELVCQFRSNLPGDTGELPVTCDPRLLFYLVLLCTPIALSLVFFFLDDTTCKSRLWRGRSWDYFFSIHSFRRMSVTYSWAREEWISLSRTILLVAGWYLLSTEAPSFVSTLHSVGLHAPMRVVRGRDQAPSVGVFCTWIAFSLPREVHVSLGTSVDNSMDPTRYRNYVRLGPFKTHKSKIQS